jgi:hypothetical protein
MLNEKKYLLNRFARFINCNKEGVIALIIFISVANLFVINFVRQERTIYYMDQVTYWQKLDQISHNFVKEPIDTLRNVYYSVRGEDYNDFPAFLLMPFGLLFGTSRLAYILAILNFLVLIVTLSSIVFNKKFCNMCGIRSSIIPYVSVALIMLLPNFWQPILSGYPDVGGVIFINLILSLYLGYSLFKRSIRVLLLIAVLIPILILFRRWYAYWVISFFSVLVIETLINVFLVYRADHKGSIKMVLKIFIPIIVSGIIIFLIAPVFSLRIARTDYADIYSGFKSSNTLFQALSGLVSRFGLFFISLSILGAVIAIKNKKTRNFSFILLAQALIIFMLFAKTQDFGQHHLYLFIPTMLLFSSLFVTRLISQAKRFKIVLVCGLFLAATLNFLPVFTARNIGYTNVFPLFFAGFRQPPHVRNDIGEVEKILGVLEDLVTAPADRIYVLADSDTFNCQTLNRAYLSLGRHKSIAGKILWSNVVDKRDGFPHEFLTAKYVIVASPIQYEMRPEDQRVMGIPAESILEQKGIGVFFVKLPHEFNLDGNVKVYIYEKKKPFDDADLYVLSETLKSFYPDRPYIYGVKDKNNYFRRVN